MHINNFSNFYCISCAYYKCERRFFSILHPTFAPQSDFCLNQLKTTNLLLKLWWPCPWPMTLKLTVLYLAISNMPTVYDHSTWNSIIWIFKLLTNIDSDGQRQFFNTKLHSYFHHLKKVIIYQKILTLYSTFCQLFEDFTFHLLVFTQVFKLSTDPEALC